MTKVTSTTIKVQSRKRFQGGQLLSNNMDNPLAQKGLQKNVNQKLTDTPETLPSLILLRIEVVALNIAD